MTDPTTRYPLPDDPGTDPLAVPPPPIADGAATASMDAPDDLLAGAGATGSAGATPPPPAPASRAAAPPPASTWAPPKGEEHRWPAVVFGLILLAIGLWFFAEVTLGLDLPTIRWGQLWPLILIVIGVLVLYGSRLGRSR